MIASWLADSFEEVTPYDFYRFLFPEGELERKGEYVQGKYTGIVVAVADEWQLGGRRKVYRYTVTDELDAVQVATESRDFCLCAPLSYAGKRRTAENARMLYAIAVDVDHIRQRYDVPIGLINLWERHILAVKRVPLPTFIVSSGSGIHLYYVLEHPVPLFKNIAFELQRLKRALTSLIWHGTVVDIKSDKDVQQEGIYQGFRMPGTVTKSGGRARAFRTGGRVSLAYLNSFVDDEFQAKASAGIRVRSGMSLKDAAEKYPEWYEKRIVRGESRGKWAVNRQVYEWWRQRILTGAQVGHRYYCMMMLAVYAKKCSFYDEKHNPNPVTREELEKDCFELMEHMESLTVSADNHFGADDVLDALEAFDDRWTTYPRDTIAYRTAIPISANKRNRQKQADHLEEARAIRDIRAKRRGERWDARNGRKSKEDVVRLWREKHPDGKKADCIRETGLDKKTVYKHWDRLTAEQDSSFDSEQ